MLKHILFLILLTLTWALPAQVTPLPAQRVQLEAYLADRDVDQEELRTRLRAEGIEADNLTEAGFLAARPRIEAIIREMAAEATRETEATREKTPIVEDDIREAEPARTAAGETTEETPAEPGQATDPSQQVYGHQIFRNRSLEVYGATDEATPPNSYPLKVGDQVAITIFGTSQEDLLLIINENGFVQLPNRIRIPLAGIPLGDAKKLLADRLKNYYAYRDGELNIRIQVARTVNVNIFGEVENPGNFTISALNTGFNALVAAGGVTRKGSVRGIQLLRGEETTILDVYQYLRNPVQRTDLFLTNYTAIFVPLAEKVVQLEGGVLRPMFYELTEEEKISDLLAFAGNPLPTAETSVIRITRYVQGVLEVINVDLAKQPDFPLLNGDVVSVPVIENPVEDFVTVEGAVLLPGRYAFSESMTVEELLSKGRLRPGARKDVAFLFRSNDDGTSRVIRLDLTGGDAGTMGETLSRGDRLRVLSQRAFNDASTFSVTGAVRDTTENYPFPADGALTLEEAILLAGGTRRNANREVYLTRTSPENQENRSYLRLDLVDDADFLLQPRDQIRVFDNERFTDSRGEVSISGAVRTPGSFVYDESLSLRDLIFLAGGTSISAARNRVEVFRLDFVNGAQTRTLVETLNLDDPAISDFELQPFDQVVVRSAAEYEPIQNVILRGEVRYPGNYALLQNNEKLMDVIRRAGGLTPEAFTGGATMNRAEGNIGNVVLDLPEAAANPSNPANIVLRGGDTISIPKRQDLVTIVLQNTLANDFAVDSLREGRTLQVAYQGPKPASWYIKRYAGGFDNESARRRWTTVQYANGQIRETASFAGIHDFPTVRPGSTIRVPAAPEKVRRERREERFNWIGLASVIMGGVSTIVSFILVSRRANP